MQARLSINCIISTFNRHRELFDGVAKEFIGQSVPLSRKSQCASRCKFKEQGRYQEFPHARHSSTDVISWTCTPEYSLKAGKPDINFTTRRDGLTGGRVSGDKVVEVMVVERGGKRRLVWGRTFLCSLVTHRLPMRANSVSFLRHPW